MGIQQYLDAQEKAKASGGGGGGRRSGGGGGGYTTTATSTDTMPLTEEDFNNLKNKSKKSGAVRSGSVEGSNATALKQQQSLRKQNVNKKK